MKFLIRNKVECLSSHFCSGYVTQNSMMQCPNPQTFDIQVEVAKPDSENKLDFQVHKRLFSRRDLNRFKFGVKIYLN